MAWSVAVRTRRTMLSSSARCIRQRRLAGDELLALAQYRHIIRQLRLAMPGEEAGQAFLYQGVLLRRQVDILVDPPARQAVGVAVAKAHRAAALQQAEQEKQQQ
jgi:hypothetical protein